MQGIKWGRSATFALMLVVASTLFAGKAAAQGQLLEVYSAYLGSADHFNSKGARLTQPWQIIRQDRANFHKFGLRDPGDEGDRYFASAANRGRMERMILNGTIERSAAGRIVNSNVWITVEIYSDFVNVTVQ
ncbi:hypothetical protein DYI23_07865 [Roseibium polysiphoniae]|uniref:Uncharacterized protein n=1 Tax=Roseibium polysiphoniae TaxID=2571221 RepID=A0A944CB99_9HYPH|nr:hypothetical protein [Roseibium polysiphoniae]MBS8260130.1 hypothetical protein [Roseibium polysiphoniae]